MMLMVDHPWLTVWFAFFAGLLLGSFLNVCIYRLPRDLSVVVPRSFCPYCEKTISWYDNIPVISYVLLSGKCRACKEQIPIRYPLVELATAAGFASIVATFGLTAAALKFCVFLAIQVALIGSDVEERILPDEFTLGGIVAGLAFSWFVPLSFGLGHVLLPPGADIRYASLLESAISAALASGAIWLVGAMYYRLRQREGLGLGDVKMVAMIGAFLGLQGALLTLMIASLLGALGGLIYILFTGKNASTYELPFGAFLGTAALAVAVFGEIILTWYTRLGG